MISRTSSLLLQSNEKFFPSYSNSISFRLSKNLGFITTLFKIKASTIILEKVPIIISESKINFVDGVLRSISKLFVIFLTVLFEEKIPLGCPFIVNFILSFSYKYFINFFSKILLL